jgi:NADPH:quinone reductase-like Zn-dependent oxidoreductase
MKAIVLKAPGGVENFEVKEIAQPTPRPNEVLVKVKAISINPVDVKTRDGKSLYNQLKDDEHVLIGWDISGEVMTIGEEVSYFKKGDEVFGMVNFPGKGRAYAEYVVAPENHLALKPVNVSHQEAAAATLAALTAWQVLVHQAHIKPGQRVLIHAAAGGVGHYAVQIAKHFKAYVIGTASAENAGFLKELGVDEHIDYKKEKVEQKVKDVDIVLDSLGENSLKSLATLKSGGKLVSILGGARDDVQEAAKERHIEAKNYLVHSSGKDQAEIAKLLSEGQLKSYLYQTFSFEDMAKAHSQVETRKTRGKVVVEVK